MDNHHVHIAPSYMSCGVAELSNIGSDMRKVLYAIATNLYHPSRGTPYALIAWSDLYQKSNGAALAHYLRTEVELGQYQVFNSVVMDNPKTGNEIQVWWWTINHETFKAWYIKERVERAKKL